jgi:alpha-L-rhamnosidase
MSYLHFSVATVLAVVCWSHAWADSLQVNPKLLTERWPAVWVADPAAPAKGFAVLHFRRSVELAQKPQRFVVHVSADNRYRLFVNGTPVSAGPERGNPLRWYFESVDIAPQLQTGKNVISAVVWNFGEYMPWAQTSLRTAFILQGDGPVESVVNTGTGWKVLLDQSYQPVEDYRKHLDQFIVVGPGERVDAARYPWGWQDVDFDDSRWSDVSRLDTGCPYGVGTDGTWFLHPRTLPPMEESLIRVGSIRRAQGLVSPPQVFDGTTTVRVPANSKVRLLLDQTYLVTAYPELVVSRGRGSRIILTYGEALFDNRMQKGNRNEIEGRRVVGYSDVFLPDGGSSRFYRPLWFRTYRYIEMEIETGTEPLSIDDFRGKFTAYPFRQTASFKSSDPSLERVWEVGWRTARLCANETYYDCPYYEQFQYVGDTRIQALISLYVSGDDRLMRQAIQSFDDSRFPEGLTQSRYPSSSFQVIPPYSLFWIAMIHDYWMHRDDSKFVRSFFPGVESVLAWHQKHLHPSGMLGSTPWWNFVDWPDQWNWDNEKRIGGVPSLDSGGRSSILSLQLVYVLQLAADLFRNEGKPGLAVQYQAAAEKIREATVKLCWDEKRRLMADTPEKKIVSQHANALAVLVDAVPAQSQQDLMERVAADRSLIQCTMYYRFYLYRAMKKAGLGDRYVEMLKPWRDMLALGLSTFAERPEPTRSDCHAWSASPNYDLLASVCGIEPGSSAFRTVRIEPHLGPLEWVEGRVPHPKGTIQVKFTRKGTGGLEGQVSLPAGVSGELVWSGKSLRLVPGIQKVAF